MNRLIAELAEQTWAVLPEHLAQYAAALNDPFQTFGQGFGTYVLTCPGGIFAANDVAEDYDGWAPIRAKLAEMAGMPAPEADARRASPRSGSVAVVPVMGPIAKRDSLFSMIFGGTSTTRLVAQLRQLSMDDSVATILLNIDSPGGTVSGIPELGAEVRRTAETKRVVAIANDLAASAAYWIASQADEIVMTPEGFAGSVGVFMEHFDISGALEAMGVSHTYISAGKYKTEGNPYEPLTDAAKAWAQANVDETYGMFVKAVADGRSAATGTHITPAQVRSDYGEGRVMTAKDAKAAGMVDRIATYNDTIARLSGVKPAGARAEDEPAEVVADEPAAPINAAAMRTRRWRLYSPG